MKIYPLSSRQSVALASLVFAVALTGCSLAPEYERPASPVNATWPASYTGEKIAADKTNLTVTADIGWRDFFRDSLLQELITIALHNNRDLRKAALNVDAAQALYRIQRAELLPNLNASGALDVGRVPADVSAAQTTDINRRYDLSGATTAWELDLWGRIRSLDDQALARYMALDETRIAMKISLVSAVAGAYLTLRADQELLQLTKKTLTSQQRSSELTRQLVRTGNATELDLRMAEIAMRSAQVNLAAYTRQAIQDRNALELLLGQSLTPELSRRLDDVVTLPEGIVPTTLPVGLPSELLVRRPDIRSAEHQLRAANANIGAARAAFFPAITLTGTAGTASTSLDGLFEPGSGSWRFLPQITLPLFQGGALLARLDIAHIQKRIEIASYEKTIQEAFREVSDGLSGQRTLDDQLHAEQLSVIAGQNAYDLAALRFREGEDDYLALLDTHRMLYGSQQALVRTRLIQQMNIINLYKALGGGWSEDTVKVKSQIN
ncbi:efflux transporter outer membrane subunit [Salmonella enterica]|nr:efflux transporter outer membrane subunit [Salmonella enterica]